MKLKHFTPLPGKLAQGKKHGFALIASLTLMMLLTMLAVGILAMASTQNRIAMQAILQAEARQQALVGLDAAIGALQMELGPDRRVTASSGIVSAKEGSGPQHILGVWDSWDGPIYGERLSGKGGKIQATYDQGRSSMFRRWLISCRDERVTRDFQGLSKLGTRRPGERICMVGEGTLGERLAPTHYVYADLLPMPAAGAGNEACFAWWVCGENQKSLIAYEDRPASRNTLQMLQRTWDTPGPMFVGSDSLDFLPDTIEIPEKMLTMASVPLVSDSSHEHGMPYFFDVTTYSYSLPVNVRTGGLKQDLCLLLNKETLKGTDFAPRSNQDCPIAEDRAIPSSTGTGISMPIGSWQTLYAYYNCWPDGTAKESRNVTARLLGDVNNSYTRISGISLPISGGTTPQSLEDYSPSGSSSVYDTRSLMDSGDSAAGYARTPVLLSYMCTFGLVEEDHVSGGNPVKTTDGEQVHRLSMCFSPMFLWWNPYNVPMRIRGDQLWAQSIPYKTIWLQTYAVSQAGTWNYSWSTYAMYQNAADTGFGFDFGNYFQESTTSGSKDIIFQPGEILFFSHGSKFSDRLAAFSHPFILGYNPSAVADYNARFYTMGSGRASTDPGVASAANMEAGNFKLRLRMGISASGGSYQTDGIWYAPDVTEAISVMNGYAGSFENISADSGKGKRGHGPQRFLMGWYDPGSMGENDTIICDEFRNDAVWRADGSQRDKTVPYFIAAVGVAPKSANINLDARVFEGQDYRTKSWQHSSPALWGSAIIKPNDQQRQYHPYQLAVLDVGAGLSACPMDSIGRNGVLGINSDGEQVSFVSVMELPQHPPFSLAGFSGMRLTPGWYASSGGSQDAFRRIQYQSGVPGVGIGNSFADPCLPADGIFATHTTNIPTGNGYANSKIFNNFYDHGLLINDALWDRWFCSSISDMPSDNGRRKAEQVLQNFLSGKEELPVSRYKRTNSPYSDQAIIQKVMDEDGWMHIAQFLMIEGGFNVNSLSVDAWASVLQGLAKRKLVTNVDGQKLKEVDSGKSESDVLFSRFAVSTTDRSIDDLGGYSMIQGSPELRGGSGITSAWGEVRKLSPESIRELAEEIVKQVRTRGPFLSMSDFINRRLQTGSKLALSGALQSAIDQTDINRNFQEIQSTPMSGGDLYKYPEAEKGSIYTAAPGYLIQSDVLASLGNILTVRDDTFTVRSYGCVRNEKSHHIVAQAWCEAVVQRTIDYVDPTNTPDETEFDPDGARQDKLSKINRSMGRCFRIVSFKWLDAWDI